MRLLLQGFRLGEESLGSAESDRGEVREIQRARERARERAKEIERERARERERKSERER